MRKNFELHPEGGRKPLKDLTQGNDYTKLLLKNATSASMGKNRLKNSEFRNKEVIN